VRAFSCAVARRRLQAFHDGELSVGDQIAVRAHVETCVSCAATLEDFDEVRSALRGVMSDRHVLTRDEAAVFNATVRSRITAEEEASLVTYVRELFDDMHLVYAGLGAAGAALACLVIMLSMMRFATAERPDSLAAIVNVLATPLECESGNDGGDVTACRARWEERSAERFQRANESAEQDAIFALEAVITQRGRLANFEVMRAERHRRTADQVKLIEGLLDVVSRARLDYAPASQAPAANMLWLQERATVRASKPAPLDVPLPPKKRADSTSGRRSPAVA
jgi:hypothetical protein